MQRNSKNVQDSALIVVGCLIVGALILAGALILHIWWN